MLEISLSCYHQWHSMPTRIAFLFGKIGVKLTTTFQAGFDVDGAKSHRQRGNVVGHWFDNVRSLPRLRRA
jgi:hypothetical protein